MITDRVRLSLTHLKRTLNPLCGYSLSGDLRHEALTCGMTSSLRF